MKIVKNKKTSINYQKKLAIISIMALSFTFALIANSESNSPSIPSTASPTNLQSEDEGGVLKYNWSTGKLELVPKYAVPIYEPGTGKFKFVPTLLSLPTIIVPK